MVWIISILIVINIIQLKMFNSLFDDHKQLHTENCDLKIGWNSDNELLIESNAEIKRLKKSLHHNAELRRKELNSKIGDI